MDFGPSGFSRHETSTSDTCAENRHCTLCSVAGVTDACASVTPAMLHNRWR
ncbi:hypothetical protein AVEN_86785-1, partial [Araneus ventricosus]